MIHEVNHSLGRGSDHYFTQSVRPSVHPSQNFKIKRQSLPAGTVGWPSRSLMTPICVIFFLFFLELPKNIKIYVAVTIRNIGMKMNLLYVTFMQCNTKLYDTYENIWLTLYIILLQWNSIFIYRNYKDFTWEILQKIAHNLDFHTYVT